MLAIDLFEKFNEPSADIINASASQSFSIIPSDTDELEYVTRMLYVGSAGDISCLLTADESITIFKNIPAGTVLPLRVRKIFNSGTTASQIVGLL